MRYIFITETFSALPPMNNPLPNTEGLTAGLDLSCSLVSDFMSSDKKNHNKCYEELY